MTDRPETRNTINGVAGVVDLDYMRDDVKRGNLDDGYFDAAPTGNYEASLDDRDVSDDRPFIGLGPGFQRGGTLHAGQIEADGFTRTHGDEDQYGFVRRPNYKSDVERT